MKAEDLIRIVEETGHHPMGPSAASRWMQCPGSVDLTRDIPDEGSPYAREGTAAHTLGEICLSEKCDAVDVEGYTDEMRDYIQGYVNYVRGVADGARIFVEQELNLSCVIPEGMGTADAIIIKGDELHVMDLKYGMVEVHPDHNPQLMIYAIGALDAITKKDIHVDHVVLHIYQPRAGGAKSWGTTPADLRIFARDVRKAADLCLEDDAPLNPSEKACEWCRAKATCPALYQKSLELVGGDFDVLPSIDSLTDEQIKLVLTNKSLIEKWLKAIEASVFSRIEHGEAFKGFKMVEGRSLRKWSDSAEGVLSKLLGEAAFEKKLIGITAAEKALGKKQLAELGITEKPQGKPTLVPETDKRPALPQIVNDFD